MSAGSYQACSHWWRLTGPEGVEAAMECGVFWSSGLGSSGLGSSGLGAVLWGR